MRFLLLVVVSLAVLASACSSDGESGGDGAANSPDAGPTAGESGEPPAAKQPPADNGEGEASGPIGLDLASAPGVRTRYDGVVGDSTEVTMWFAQQDDFVRGEMLGAGDAAEPGIVLGHRAGDAYNLFWFNSDGTVRASMRLDEVLDGEVLAATWFEAEGQQDLRLAYAGDLADSYFFDDENLVTGSYRYAFWPHGQDTAECCGAQGTVTITDLGPDQASVEMQATTAGPSFNVAMVGPTVLARIGEPGNRMVFEEVGDLYDCAIEITAFDGFVFVDYLDERRTCAFGFNATVAGVYVLPGRFG